MREIGLRFNNSLKLLVLVVFALSLFVVVSESVYAAPCSTQSHYGNVCGPGNANLCVKDDPVSVWYPNCWGGLVSNVPGHGYVTGCHGTSWCDSDIVGGVYSANGICRSGTCDTGEAALDGSTVRDWCKDGWDGALCKTSGGSWNGVCVLEGTSSDPNDGTCDTGEVAIWGGYRNDCNLAGNGAACDRDVGSNGFQQDGECYAGSCCNYDAGETCNLPANNCNEVWQGTKNCASACTGTAAPTRTCCPGDVETIPCTSLGNACGVTAGGTRSRTCTTSFGWGSWVPCSASPPDNPVGLGNLCNFNACNTPGGTLTCGGGSNTLYCSGGVPPVPAESCNNADDDCDGQIDEGYNKYWYYDADLDNYGTGAYDWSCNDLGAYHKRSWEMTSTTGDCGPNDPNIHPGRPDSSVDSTSGYSATWCNGVDNNCDGAGCRSI